jgi:hypothetical protein
VVLIGLALQSVIIRRGRHGPDWASAAAIVCLLCVGAPSRVVAQGVDQPSVQISMTETGELVAPSTTFESCTDAEERDYFLTDWAAKGDPVLIARAERFHMTPRAYAGVLHEIFCWTLLDGQAQSLERIRRMRYGVYPQIICSVSWNQTCEDTITLRAPAGWQVCRILYRVTERRGDTRIQVEPDDWIGSGHGTLGFRSYRVRFRAAGDGQLLDPDGAKLVLTDVGLDVVSDKLTASEREGRGCDVPVRSPPPLPVPSSPSPSQAPTPNVVQQIPGADTTRRRVRMTNAGSVANCTYYEIWADDRFWGREMLHESGVLALQPNSTWDKEFYRREATGWRFMSRMVQVNPGGCIL